MSMKKMLAVVAAASLVAVAAPAFANPFSDVPFTHWAYDAVETLAAKGIIDGYPDGTFKGKKVMTRYEIATVVAKALANAGNEDIEQLKALVVEFGPELEALGVKVDGFDARLAKLEKGLSGWSISGELQLDFNAADGLTELAGDRDGFEFDSARLFLHRDMANGLSFDLEYGDGAVDRYYLTAEDFFGVEGLTVRLGQFDIDFEGDDELYYGEHEDAGAFMGLTYRGAQITKDFGIGEFTVFGASNIADDGIAVYNSNDSDEFYGARLKVNFGEKFWLSANAYFINAEGNGNEDSAYGGNEAKFAAYWVGAGINFAEGITLKGAYYFEDIDQFDGETDIENDDPNAYKIVLDVSQDVLKFTNLWAEYAHYDEGFACDNGAALYAFHGHFGDALDEVGMEMSTDIDVLFLALKQEWSEKWSTFERYTNYDVDGADDIVDWAVGIGYQYSPELYFELAFNQIDIGDNATDLGLTDDDGSYIRFRTLLSF